MAVVSTCGGAGWSEGSGIAVLHVVEEGAEGDAHLLVLDQEGVVAMGAVELDRAGLDPLVAGAAATISWLWYSG